MAKGELVVVETEDDAHVGTVQVLEDHLVIRSGFVGRPVLVAIADVVRITRAREHEDIDTTTA